MKHESLPSLNNYGNDIDNDNGNDWSTETNWHVLRYLTNQLLIDHLVLSESNAFEQLVHHCQPLALQILHVIFSPDYIGSTKTTLPNAEVLLPKLMSLVVNHWIAAKPSMLLVNDNDNDNNRGLNILQSVVRLCVIGPLQQQERDHSSTTFSDIL
ncbi:hypothetical protein SAMD00019534_075030 [Acytostelium subglobosum LB1]|uniref:hypothetical protein n=1 Tax=Acytostelium subglobosum LB1 TaxID=1410327 RepID=UPI000645146D|nr:hypothetical protein SAMD00019534_075030 [Acytostelium subglobosum LB1]GAM24328.1 hypothetical protein SAMD00019534_075030 [Acytostelium subglobosum LB1]|eukprot:XP_012752654.1 hypothetical protein SAMD00019534_075030 [Acytostelium subglobosum LB1]